HREHDLRGASLLQQQRGGEEGDHQSFTPVGVARARPRRRVRVSRSSRLTELRIWSACSGESAGRPGGGGGPSSGSCGCWPEGGGGCGRLPPPPDGGGVRCRWASSRFHLARELPGTSVSASRRRSAAALR